MRKILVTGGLGFLGSHVAEILCRKGKEVVILDNQSTGSILNIPVELKNRIRIIIGDIRDESVVRKALTGCDTVCHLAVECLSRSLTDPELVHSVNATGSLVLLLKAKEAKIKRFVYVSSSEVYGSACYVPMDEGHPLNPHTVYAAAKLAGEKYAWSVYKTYGLPITIVRPFNLFGPRQRGQNRFPNDIYGSIISRSIYNALRNRNIVIYGDGKQARDFTYVTDAARAIVNLGGQKKAVGEIVNIASGRSFSILAIAKKIIKLTSSRSKIVFAKDRPGDLAKLLGSSKKARKLIDYNPQFSFDEGLREYISWSKSNIQL